MSIKEFIKCRYTAGSAPKVRTVQDRIKRGEIPGFKDGKNWMVNITRLEQGEPAPVDDVDEIVSLLCAGKKETRLKAVS